MRWTLHGPVLLLLCMPGVAAAAEPPRTATTIAEAVTGGKAQLSLRLRHESVDDDALATNAAALTLRTRLTWQSASLHGFSLALEADDVRAIVKDYNSTTNGRTSRPIVADPIGTDLNRAALEWQRGAHRASVGRQRIVFDNHRFIGNVGWRQNEQTYDGVLLRTTALPRTEFGYAYVYNVNRIYGPHGGSQLADWHGDVHFFNAKFSAGAAGSVAAFAYLMDFSNAAAQSNATYGAVWSGSPTLGGEWKLPFQLSYATQSDHGDFPTDYRADYWQVEVGVARGPYSLKLGRETLEGDASRPNRRFQTPLATLHIFQGWADKFLTTPPQGVEDTYVSVAARIRAANCQLAWHDYRAEAVDRGYGTEWNASVSFTFAKQYELLFKLANYRADGFGTDTTKLWLMATATFQ
jgi:Alginate export